LAAVRPNTALFNKGRAPAAGYGLLGLSYWTGRTLKANIRGPGVTWRSADVRFLWVRDGQGQARGVSGADAAKWGHSPCLPPDVQNEIRGLNFPHVGRVGPPATASGRGLRNGDSNVVWSLIGSRTDKGRTSTFSDYPFNKDRDRYLQQRGHRVDDQSGRVRIAGASAQRAVPGAHRAVGTPGLLGNTEPRAKGASSTYSAGADTADDALFTSKVPDESGGQKQKAFRAWRGAR